MKNFLTILILFVSLGSMGQGYYWQSGSKQKKIQNLTLDAGLGLRMYFGDIQQKGSVMNPVKIGYGLGVRYQMRPNMGLALQLEGRGYKGKAEHAGYVDAVDEMNGKLWGGHLMFQYSWLRWEDFTRKQFTDRDPVTKTNMFLGVGFGGALFASSYNSRTYSTVTVVDSTGKKIITNFPVDASNAAAGFAMYVPVVLGGRYRIKPNVFVGLELQRHFYLTKNVDALASKKFDGMGTMTVRLGYTFGQNKRTGDTKKVSKKGKLK
jgi:hypothetical protein